MFYADIEEDLKLKILMPYDDEILFKLVDKNRDYLREWLPWLDEVTSSADIRAFVNNSYKRMSDNEGFDLGIVYKNSLIGVIGFHNYDKLNKNISLGFWIDEKYSRKGLITKTCKYLINYAFDRFNMNSVEIHTAKNNVKSKSVAEKLGFFLEGEVDNAEWLYDHYVKHQIFSIKKDDWKNPEI